MNDEDAMKDVCPGCGSTNIEADDVTTYVCGERTTTDATGKEASWSRLCLDCSALWGATRMESGAGYTFHHTGAEVRALEAVTGKEDSDDE